MKERVEAALKVLEGMGAVIEEVSLPHTEYAVAAYYLLASSEASSNLARFDGVRYGVRAGQSGNLLDLYLESRSQGFGPEVKRRIMLGTYALSSGYYDAFYLKAQKARTLIKRDFDQVFEQYDVIIGPTAPTPAFKLGAQVGDPLTMYLNDILTIPVSLAGVPAISVPCGFSEGLLRSACKSSANRLTKARCCAWREPSSKTPNIINSGLTCRNRLKRRESKPCHLRNTKPSSALRSTWS